MEAFGTARRLASWAGICPGNHESAGKSKGGKRRKGNVYLRRILCEVAHAAARTHGVQFGPYKQQLAKRRGAGSAVVATAHKILRIVFAMLRDGKPYCDPQIVVDLHRPVRPDAPAVGGADAVDPNEYWQYCQNPCVFRVAKLPVAVSCRGRCATSLP